MWKRPVALRGDRRGQTGGWGEGEPRGERPAGWRAGEQRKTKAGRLLKAARFARVLRFWLAAGVPGRGTALGQRPGDVVAWDVVARDESARDVAARDDHHRGRHSCCGESGVMEK